MFFKKNLKRILIVLLIPPFGTIINFFVSMVNVYKFRRNKADILKWYFKLVLVFILMIIVLFPLTIALEKIYIKSKAFYFIVLLFIWYIYIVSLGIFVILFENNIVKNKEKQFLL